ncbi:MAG: D-tyrosyl-tRNA(Tyr) deacylase [Osedax symbiont Rs2]|nr:MAG: D-tyrosyl-tRNA(Tyr) deacylase [Osedax symbiont Rs2]
MKALIQRVTQAKVEVAGSCIGAIDNGILLLLGVEKSDTTACVDKMLKKILNYRIFSDSNGKMNLSLSNTNGGLLIVSQFTLVAQTNKGSRPGFSVGASPEHGQFIYDDFVTKAKVTHGDIACGEFGGDMQVSLINDGPVTFMFEIND